MDTGSKSLAQLSEEGKETKYVNIEVGSKVSGYTKDYLERLCRLNKVNYRLRGNGDFVIELDSLLKETQTILLSYEGITFVEKTNLMMPTKTLPVPPQFSTKKEVASLSETAVTEQPSQGDVIAKGDSHAPEQVYTQPFPRFGDDDHFAQQSVGGNPLSYVGRMVVSDGKSSLKSTPNETQHPINSATKNDIPLFHSTLPIPKEELPVPRVVAVSPQRAPLLETYRKSPEMSTRMLSNSDAVPIPPPLLEHKDEEKKVFVPPLHVNSTDAVSILQEPLAPVDVPRHVEKSTLTSATIVHDDWEDLLFGEESKAPVEGSIVEDKKEEVSYPSRISKYGEDIKTKAENSAPMLTTFPSVPAPQAPSKVDVVSPYHPIQTSVDATAHYDDGPLFPPLSRAQKDIPKEELHTANTIATSFTPPLEKVVVFNPNEFLAHTSEKQKNSEITPVIPPVVASETIIPHVLPGVIPPPPVSLQETPVNAAPLVAVFQSPLLSIEPQPVSQAEAHVMTRTPLPLMRVMPEVPLITPSVLPARLNEQHLLLAQKYPLTTSKSLNIVFGLFIGVTSLLLLGGLSGQLSVDLNSASYVAAVGAVNEKPSPGQVEIEESPAHVLPFSNEVVVSTSTNSNALDVTPVYKDGVGQTYHYEIVPSNTPADPISM